MTLRTCVSGHPFVHRDFGVLNLPENLQLLSDWERESHERCPVCMDISNEIDNSKRSGRLDSGIDSTVVAREGRANVASLNKRWSAHLKSEDHRRGAAAVNIVHEFLFLGGERNVPFDEMWDTFNETSFFDDQGKVSRVVKRCRMFRNKKAMMSRYHKIMGVDFTLVDFNDVRWNDLDNCVSCVFRPF